MKTPLTTDEENLIKDMLKYVANDARTAASFAKIVGMEIHVFDDMCCDIWNKLGNGRVTVV